MRSFKKSIHFYQAFEHRRRFDRLILSLSTHALMKASRIIIPQETMNVCMLISIQYILTEPLWLGTSPLRTSFIRQSLGEISVNTTVVGKIGVIATSTTTRPEIASRQRSIPMSFCAKNLMNHLGKVSESINSVVFEVRRVIHRTFGRIRRLQISRFSEFLCKRNTSGSRFVH